MMRCIFSKLHAIIACFASALLLAGCASHKTSYMGIKLLPAQGNLALDNLSESDAILIKAAKKHRAEVIMACEAAVKSSQKAAASKLVMKPITDQKPDATKEVKVFKKPRRQPLQFHDYRLHLP